MKLPSYYYPQMEMKYRELLDQKNAIADKANKQLLSVDPEVIKTEARKHNLQDEIKEIMFYVIFKYFEEALFFHTDQTLAKLKYLKVSPSVIRWFVSLSKIHEQFDVLRKEGIKVDSLLAFSYIKAYLKSKFSVDIFLQFKTVNHDGVRMTILSKELIKLRAKKRINGNDLLASQLNYCSAELKNVLVTFPFNKQNPTRDKLFEFSRGKTEAYYLQKLLDECFDYDHQTMTISRFLSLAYNLLSLLIQDRIFIKEEEFLSSRRRLYQSYKSFDAYKAKKIRSLIYPKGKMK